MEIEVRGLTKVFGPRAAVTDLSFTVPEGQVTGFLGPNGSGKTTTLRMALGLVRPTAGRVLIGGIDVVVNSIRTQTFAPDAFTGLGIDLADKRLIAVKSSQHFEGHFAPLADAIIRCATPGAIQMNFAEIAYLKRRDLNYFPRVADPLS